jgi:hypothetical protein
MSFFLAIGAGGATVRGVGGATWEGWAVAIYLLINIKYDINLHNMYLSFTNNNITKI